LRFPAKWLVLSALGLAVLAAHGVRAVLEGQGLRLARWTVTALLAACVAALVVLLAAGPRAEAFLEARPPAPVDGAAARAAPALALTELRARGLLDRRRTGLLAVALLALDLLTAARPGIERGPPELLAPSPLVALVHEEPGAAQPPPRFDGALGLQAALEQVAARSPSGPSLLDYDRLYAATLRANVGYAHGVRNVLAFE